MRTLLVTLLLTSASASLLAGHLDVAVIQFSEGKAPDELASALAKANLSEITRADRTRTTQPELQGGTVLFAQRLPIVPGTSFQITTRLKNASAALEGHLDGGRVTLSVSLMEGVQAGLRSFQKKVYAGSGPLVPHRPKLLSLRAESGRMASLTKGRIRRPRYELTTALVAQYTP